MLKKLNSTFVSAILCAASVFITPFNLAAAYQGDCCVPQCEEECDPCCGGISRNAWVYIGAAALGAAAGAGAGYAAGHNSGSRGSTGPIGPAFTFATGTGTITFDISIILDLTTLSGPIQPFVELPDSSVLFAPAFGNLLSDLAILQTRTIIVPAPALVGTYHPGINVPLSITASSLLVAGTATTSRGPTTSSLNFPATALSIGIFAPETQITTEFTFGPDTAPVIP